MRDVGSQGEVLQGKEPVAATGELGRAGQVRNRGSCSNGLAGRRMGGPFIHVSLLADAEPLKNEGGTDPARDS